MTTPLRPETLPGQKTESLKGTQPAPATASPLHPEGALGSQLERMTAAELRAALQALTERLDQIEASLAAVREGLTAAASQPAASPAAGETMTMEATILLMSYDDNGQPVYKVKGGQYMKFGVRVWPEVLPALGVDPATLKPGPNPINLRVRVLMGEHGPRKVVSLA
jgi:hypothetical protein